MAKANNLFNLADLLGLEDYIGTISSGHSNPAEMEFAEDVPLELISAMQDLYNARKTTKSIIESLKSEK